MINRHEFIQEMQLRQYVREAIKVVKKNRKIVEQKNLHEETELRVIIRHLLSEADPAVATDAVHSNTGINALEDLFKNTNLLTVLRQGYKSLTSKLEQRESYKNHILNAVDSSLEVQDATFSAGAETEVEEIDIQEVIDIDVGNTTEDNPAFLDVEKQEPTEEEEIEEFSLTGQDKTGRNRAYTDYKDVEKSIITAFDDLDDPSDRNMFKDYMLTNLKLYFERFEEELQVDLPEPDIQTAGEDELQATETEADQGLGLQERINLDMDEIVEWLLLNGTKS